MPPAIDVSTHSRPKAAADINPVHGDTVTVSTHSRPKAAGYVDHLVRRLRCFNTQPPEGGWLSQIPKWLYRHVSTHSRPKAADLSELLPANRHKFQHTAARRRLIGQGSLVRYMIVSTHSRPKAAGERMCPACMDGRGFNTQPPEGGCRLHAYQCQTATFVSTHSRPKAAVVIRRVFVQKAVVSTHSRPKAAATSFGWG